MQTNYKEHVIQSMAPRANPYSRWHVKIIVSWIEGPTNQMRQFDGPNAGFATQQEAEVWGIEFGKKWINDGKPDLHKR